MDNLPAPTPNRQWFRLASLARLEALGQTSDPTTLSSASTTLAQGPTSSSTPAAPRPPSPAPTNPQPRPSTANGAPPLQRIRVPSRSPTPPQSPKIIKPSMTNPSDSPKVPQQLQPHPEPEPEPKMPLLPKLSSNASNSVTTMDSSTNGKMQENSGRSHIDAKEHTATSTIKKKKFTENNENQIKMITMAGDNTGAYFELLPSRRANNVMKGEQNKGQASKDSSHEGGKKEEAKPKRNVVNSNVQSVNNSILFGTSCTLQSPGVHIAFANRRQSKYKGVAE